MLRRAIEAHRPPQAFLWCAIVWLIVGLGLALATLAGEPFGPAAVYVLLVGWIGQMVNGHLYHIGVRLIATMARGDDDETSPGELLKEPLTWISFITFQIAVACGAGGLLWGEPSMVALAACSGFAGWIVMAVNLALARKCARMPATTLSLLGRVSR